MKSDAQFDLLAINTIRTLSMDAVQKANSGHPGTPMALAPLVYILYDRFLRFNPRNPDWFNRDRFVLSAGHASMLLYGILHLTGYDLSLDDIKTFRQLHSKCAGHPELGLCPGVETTTGPLGQGAATSVGMAIAERWLESYFNRPGHKLIDYRIFALASDGDMMEGMSGEAASLAGHLGLSNLLWFYDNNQITIEGQTSLAFSEDVAARFVSYNWNVRHVRDVNDLQLLNDSISNALKETSRPSLIIVDSHIAYGSPQKQDTASAHGEPLGDEEIRAAKISYGWDPDKKFHVPDEIQRLRENSIQKGKKLEDEWNQQLEFYAREFPELANQFNLLQSGKLPSRVYENPPIFPADSKGPATRQANHKILNQIAEQVPWILGGSADLGPSTKTLIASSAGFEKENYTGRNFHFGIRENAMAAIANGLALSKIRPYAATFLIFSDYMRPSLRLSALMRQPVIYIFTHDSIGLGEDGPTHQPVEHLASLRAIPNLDVIRPADANELSVLWKYILGLKNKPAALILTRQNVPTFDRTIYHSAEGALRGGYILADSDEMPEVILIATGSEVQLCLAAFEKLKSDGISARVVSIPCRSLFESQPGSYREEVLSSSVTARVTVEAGSGFGWEKYAGPEGEIVSLDTFGASAPHKDLFQEFGFTVDEIIRRARLTISRAIRKSEVEI